MQRCCPQTRRRYAGSCSIEGLEGCRTLPPQPTQLPCLRPARRGCPDLIKGVHSRCSSSGNRTGDITYSHTREGFVYLAGRDGTAYSAKDCWLRPSRDTYEPACPHNALQKLAVRNCQPINGVTILPLRSGEHRYTSAEYTDTMNTYGSHCFGRKNQRVSPTAPQQNHSTPPAQERTRQPVGYTTPEEKQSKR